MSLLQVSNFWKAKTLLWQWPAWSFKLYNETLKENILSKKKKKIISNEKKKKKNADLQEVLYWFWKDFTKKSFPQWFTTKKTSLEMLMDATAT